MFIEDCKNIKTDQKQLIQMSYVAYLCYWEPNLGAQQKQMDSPSILQEKMEELQVQAEMAASIHIKRQVSS
jgi:hypothetical protein